MEPCAKDWNKRYSSQSTLLKWRDLPLAQAIVFISSTQKGGRMSKTDVVGGLATIVVG